jgi:hypothetical protein
MGPLAGITAALALIAYLGFSAGLIDFFFPPAAPQASTPPPPPLGRGLRRCLFLSPSRIARPSSNPATASPSPAPASTWPSP